MPGKGAVLQKSGTDVPKCEICGKIAEASRSFACRRCRKSPLCLDHLDSEYRVCSGCAAEERISLYNNLLRQGRSVRGFLRLTEFLFVLAVMFFVAKEFFWEQLPEFIKGNVVFDYVFLWGGAAIAGMVLGFIVIRSQKGRLKEVGDKIEDHKARSRFSRH